MKEFDPSGKPYLHNEEQSEAHKKHMLTKPKYCWCDMCGFNRRLGEKMAEKFAEDGPKITTAYTVKGSRIYFNAGCEMTARELAQVLAQMS